MTIIERAQRYISRINAVSGQGGHTKTFKVACCLRHGFALSLEDSFALMMGWNNSNAIPPWSENDIRHKLLSAEQADDHYQIGQLLNPNERVELGAIEDIVPRPRKARWPNCDEKRVIDLLENSLVTLGDFYAGSPANPSELKSPYEIVDHLFCRGDLVNAYLCLGKSVFEALTLRRDKWNGKLDSRYWRYIVPNPMVGLVAETATGKLSPRAKKNVLEQRFIVIECDFDQINHPEIFRFIKERNISVQDVCTTVLTELTKTAKLAIAVNSGGKSIHGWFPVRGASYRVRIEFFRRACLLGADPKMANLNQWTRFPTGIRENGVEQSLEYFDPDPFLVNF